MDIFFSFAFKSSKLWTNNIVLYDIDDFMESKALAKYDVAFIGHLFYMFEWIFFLSVESVGTV